MCFVWRYGVVCTVLDDVLERTVVGCVVVGRLSGVVLHGTVIFLQHLNLIS